MMMKKALLIHYLSVILLTASCLHRSSHMTPDATPIETLTEQDFMKGTMIEAAKAGDLATIKQIMSEHKEADGYNMDVVMEEDKNGRTPLYWATSRGHKEIVKYLIEEGEANEEKTYGKNFTSPLTLACVKGHVELVDYLVNDLEDVNVLINDKKLATPLHWAAMSGNMEIVEILVKKLKRLGVNKEYIIDKYGDTPAHYAAMKGHRSVVEYLVEQGICDPEAKDVANYTPKDYYKDDSK